MTPHHSLALALDPSLILHAGGLTPDPWQRQFLASTERQVLLNCCRQAGKSTVVSALALHTILFTPGSLVLILSPSQRQSGEMFRKVLDHYNHIQRPVKATYETQLKLELANGSRVICLPGREETIRGFSSPALLLIDEAARVPDDLYRSVRPMLAVSGGRLVALSTPFGQRGWFYEEWEGDAPFKKICVTWHDCPRITEPFIQEEMRSLGQAWVDQEYNCLFTALEGLVYPEFDLGLIDIAPPATPKARYYGGIDFGWRNPFAALWGFHEPESDILYLTNERYARETPLHEHIAALPKANHKAKTDQGRDYLWYADPAGATEIEEMRAANLKVLKGYNDIRLGIAAVTARIRTGRLKVLRTHCPNLREEAKLYRYPNASERSVLGENPIDDHNHALGALRYLISRLDARFIGKLRKLTNKNASTDSGPIEADALQEQQIDRAKSVRNARPWLSVHNPDLWTTF